PASLTILAGEGQTSTVNAPVPILPSVRLADAVGNAVAGASVSFTPAVGSGTAAPPIVTTTALGIATLTSWTLGTAAVPQTMTVSSAGVPSVTFHATGKAGAPAHYVVTVSPTTQTAGGTVSVFAQLIDAFSNSVPESGHTVNWTSTSGGSFASTTQS